LHKSVAELAWESKMPRNNSLTSNHSSGTNCGRRPIDQVFKMGAAHGDLGAMALHEAQRGTTSVRRHEPIDDQGLVEDWGFHIIDDDDIPDKDFGEY
jgi:hypothetical protein